MVAKLLQNVQSTRSQSSYEITRLPAHDLIGHGLARTSARARTGKYDEDSRRNPDEFTEFNRNERRSDQYNSPLLGRPFRVGLQMILTTLVALAASASTPEAAQQHHVSAAAPRIVCEIEMPNWCLAHFAGTVNMVDQGDTRVWSLQSTVNMKEGPLVIIEKKACGVSNPFAPRFVGRKAVGGAKGQQVNSVEYEIAAGGCSLEFRWPVLKEDDRSYEQTMLYGVLVGEKEKTTQLYRLSK
jgi:hypothetical protein